MFWFHKILGLLYAGFITLYIIFLNHFDLTLSEKNKTLQYFQTEHNLRSETNYFVNLSHILSKINLVSNLKYSIILSKYLFMRWADNIISGRNDGSHQFSKFSVILIWLLGMTNERSVPGNVIFISPITEIYIKFDIFWNNSWKIYR